MKSSSSEEINEAFKSVGFEEKLWLFCKRHARAIFWGGMLLLVVGGWCTLHGITRGVMTHRMQSAFNQLTDIPSKEAFVRKYHSFPLSGMVALSLGDEYMEAKDFEQAERLYKRATGILDGNTFEGRAWLGLALAKYERGDIVGAKNILNDMIYQVKQDVSWRSMAGMLYANILLKEENREGISRLIEEWDGLGLSLQVLQVIKALTSNG